MLAPGRGSTVVPSLISLLQGPGPTLIASLPRNDADLAQAAAAGGAHALKVHIHAHHQASGTGFGDLATERAALEAVRGSTDGPIGVVVGDGSAVATPQEVRELADMGMDFIDAYTRHMPAWMLRDPEMEIMGALAPEDSPEEWAVLAGLFDCMEAAVLPHERYGTALTAHDLSLYSRIRASVDRPLVVPTQLALTSQDVPLLAAMGMEAIMIGAIVTGKDTAGMEAACRDFRAACDQIPSQ
jgi:hypothetical protein